MLLALGSLTLSFLFAAGDPPIRLKISDDMFFRGQHARVRVKTAASGYLLVLRADAEGHVRVLFPLEPTDDASIRGGKEFEIRGRGNREAFTVDDREGSGKVLAAVSSQPFQLDSFSRGGHWDYAALSGGEHDRDAEALLVSLVNQMSSGSYDYDLVTYTVTQHPQYRRGTRWVGGGWGGWGWGGGRRPWGWGGWYDPWFGCFSCLRW